MKRFISRGQVLLLTLLAGLAVCAVTLFAPYRAPQNRTELLVRRMEEAGWPLEQAALPTPDPSTLADWQVSASLTGSDGGQILLLTGGAPDALPELDADYMLGDQDFLVVIHGSSFFADTVIRAFMESGMPPTVFHSRTLWGPPVELRNPGLPEDVVALRVDGRVRKAAAQALGVRRVPELVLHTQQEQILLFTYADRPEGAEELLATLPPQAHAEQEGCFVIVTTAHNPE